MFSSLVDTLAKMVVHQGVCYISQDPRSLSYAPRCRYSTAKDLTN